jgi:hypothetical protein
MGTVSTRRMWSMSHTTGPKFTSPRKQVQVDAVTHIRVGAHLSEEAGPWTQGHTSGPNLTQQVGEVRVVMCAWSHT